MAEKEKDAPKAPESEAKPATKAETVASPAEKENKAAEIVSENAAAEAPAKKKRPAREKRERKERSKPEPPAFDLQASLDLGRDYDRVVRTAFNELSGGIADQVEMLLAIPAETERKVQRELERTRKTLAKALAKATQSAGTRLLSPGQLSFSELRPGTEAGRVQMGPQEIPFSESDINRFLGQFRSLESLAEGENSALSHFPDLPATIEAPFGNSLENDYFLTGKVSFTPTAQPAFHFEMDLFAKRGKSMGMRLKFSVSHQFSAESFKNEVTLEIPLGKGQ